MNIKKIPLVNRELSWLSFNERVLQEAEDTSNPLLERLRFLGIFSNNRDEFFRVRVATLKRMTKLGKRVREAIGGDPDAILEQIHKRVLSSTQKFDRIYRAIVRELEQQGIYIVDEKHLSREQSLFVRNYFSEQVLPHLFPVMVDNAPKFPYLKDKSIYLAIKLQRILKAKKSRYALMEVPTDEISRFLVLPAVGTKRYVMLLDDVVRHCLHDIFPAHEYGQVNAYTIKLTRDAELEIETDFSKSFVEKISGSLKKRKKGVPVRFVYDEAMPLDMLAFLRRKLQVIKHDTLVPGSRYHNFKDFISFPDLEHKELAWPSIKPKSHPRFKRGESMFAAILQQDVMLHYPYQSFHHIIDLLREASIDPRVEAIDITLYRVANNSNIVKALINASKNGKRVTVVMELQARFDEENNIYWANKLQEEGATVIFGVPRLKVHSKLFLIRRRENGKVVQYAHIGSGNLNEKTAVIYTDKTLLTADKRITSEVEKIFAFYRDNLKPGSYKHLLVSPFSMRKRLMQLIDTEIDFAKDKKPASIVLKMNNLVDPEMILKLYEASQAGVKIRLLIRGICALIPGIPKHSEHIEVYSLVGRFLEHSRVFIFHNGGEQKYFISSADWMTRNLDYRSEVAVPIYDEAAQKELQKIIDLQFLDNCKLRLLGGTKENTYRRNTAVAINAQESVLALIGKKTR
jgi:polyphosphate kinase